MKGQLTSEHTRLIVPDEQLLRLGNPLGYTSDLIQGNTLHTTMPYKACPLVLIPRRRGRLLFFDEPNLSLCPETGWIYRIVGTEYKVNTPGRNQRMYILVERLWHYMRDNMTRSYFHVKLTAQCEAIVEWLETLPIERFLSLMGLSP
jgi:hypothetical protein